MCLLCIGLIKKFPTSAFHKLLGSLHWNVSIQLLCRRDCVCELNFLLWILLWVYYGNRVQSEDQANILEQTLDAFTSELTFKLLLSCASRHFHQHITPRFSRSSVTRISKIAIVTSMSFNYRATWDSSSHAKCWKMGKQTNLNIKIQFPLIASFSFIKN